MLRQSTRVDYVDDVPTQSTYRDVRPPCWAPRDLPHRLTRPSTRELLGPGWQGAHCAYAGARGKGRRLQGSADPRSRACAPTQYCLLRAAEIDHGPRLAHYKPNQPPAQPPEGGCLLVMPSQVEPSQARSDQARSSRVGQPFQPRGGCVDAECRCRGHRGMGPAASLLTHARAAVSSDAHHNTHQTKPSPPPLAQKKKSGREAALDTLFTYMHARW